MAIITIVGAGMMGSAMSFPARDNGHEVRLVGTPLDREIIERLRTDRYHLHMKRTLPEGVRLYQIEEMTDALSGADMLIGGVSSFGVDWFAENVLPVIPASLPVLSITKGLHGKPDGSLVPFPAYYYEKNWRTELSLNCVGGPCTSYELADRNQTTVAFCGMVLRLLERLKKMLATPYYHITPTTDVCGLETAVALKNAYALGVSLAIGLAEKRDGEGCVLQYNPQAALFGQAVKEMRKLIAYCGGSPEILPFGAGDLYVTIFGGRTRKIGTLLGRGIPYAAAREMLAGVTLESVAIAGVVGKAIANTAEGFAPYPLLHLVYDLINGREREIPWEAFTAL